MKADNTKSMFRAIINSQSAIKSELLGEIKKVNTKLDNLERKVDDGFKNIKMDFKKVDKRIDKIGLQLASH